LILGLSLCVRILHTYSIGQLNSCKLNLKQKNRPVSRHSSIICLSTIFLRRNSMEHMMESSFCRASVLISIQYPFRRHLFFLPGNFPRLFFALTCDIVQRSTLRCSARRALLLRNSHGPFYRREGRRFWDQTFEAGCLQDYI